MDCANNRFCRSLPPEIRENLCAHCTKRTFKKDQIVFRADIDERIVLVVDGVMTTQTDYSPEMIEEGDTPAFFINTNGLLLGIDNLFSESRNQRYEYISYVCLKDTVLARFDPAFIRNLFETNVAFAKAMYQNIAIAAAEACEFAAVLRVPDVEQSVEYLLDYASRKGFKLTQQQIADITGHNRVSVSRAISYIRANRANLWARYVNGYVRAE